MTDSISKGREDIIDDLVEQLKSERGEGKSRAITPSERAALLSILKSVIDKREESRDDVLQRSRLGPVNANFVTSCAAFGSDIEACNPNDGTCPEPEVMEQAVRSGKPWALAAVRGQSDRPPSPPRP